MLTLLIALGLFDGEVEAGTGPLAAAAERIVTAARVQPLTVIGNAIPLGAYVWARPYDPGDYRPYAISFEAEFGEQNIASIDMITMSSQAAALGIAIEQGQGRTPIITDDGKHVQLWFVMDSAMQLSPQFDAGGVRMAVPFAVWTDAALPERIELSGVLILRQQ